MFARGQRLKFVGVADKIAMCGSRSIQKRFCGMLRETHGDALRALCGVTVVRGAPHSTWGTTAHTATRIRD